MPFPPLAGTAFFEYTLRAVYSLDLSSQTGFPRNATSCISMRLSLAVWQYIRVRCTALCVLKTAERQDPDQIYPECCTQHKRHSNPRSFWRTGYPKIRKTQERNENPSSWHLEFLHSDTTGQFFLFHFSLTNVRSPELVQEQEEERNASLFPIPFLPSPLVAVRTKKSFDVQAIQELTAIHS